MPGPKVQFYLATLNCPILGGHLEHSMEGYKVFRIFCLLVYFLKVVIVKRLHLKDVKYQKSKKGHYSSQIIKYEFVNGAWERYKLTLNNSGNSDSFSITFHIITVSQFSRSVMSDSGTPWTAARQASLSITNSRSLLKLMSIELVMPSNHLILCRPLLLPPSIFLSIRVFSNESALCIRWPKYWSFSFNISPSNEHSGLISFRMDWLDLLAVQGSLW